MHTHGPKFRNLNDYSNCALLLSCLYSPICVSFPRIFFMCSFEVIYQLYEWPSFACIVYDISALLVLNNYRVNDIAFLVLNRWCDQLRARRALSPFNAVLLARTRKALSLYKIYGDTVGAAALLVLDVTSLSSVITLLVLNWQYVGNIVGENLSL